MKNWCRRNKEAILATVFAAYVIFVFATDEPIPEVTEPTETESSLIQWKEPTDLDTEPSIEHSTVGTVTEPEESEIATEIVTETETGTEIVEETETEPEEITYYCKWMDRHFTEEEFALICTTTFCESGGCSSATQKMVALTILNQIASGKFGDSVREVIYRKNNFSVTQWKDFENRGWTDKVEQSVLAAFEKNDHPRDMYYFRTDHYHKFGQPYKKVGNVYFSTDK